MYEPKEGVLTFRAEGNDTPGSPWFSRKVHWPGNLSKCATNASGVTLGRGFDMGARTKGEIIHKLLLAGIPRKQAEKFAEGAKLTHCKAADFVRK
ncbi:hypothetical protein GIX45_29235 [Erwinia sp. CPCC 100877]|nr:hypothetical protein [Erwinia sp. CPCC 100877]